SGPRAVTRAAGWSRPARPRRWPPREGCPTPAASWRRRFGPDVPPDGRPAFHRVERPHGRGVRAWRLTGRASARLELVAALAASAGVFCGHAAEVASEDEDDERQLREVYVPQPEFQNYPDRDQLGVELVTLVRVRRPDQSEALVAKEESGWEHVVLEGWRL